MSADGRLSVAYDSEQKEIVIRIGLGAIKTAVEAAPFIHQVDPSALGRSDAESLTVTDPEAFAKEVVTELLNEEEDGTTLVHEMFDDAFEKVVENGGQGYVWPAAGIP